MAAIDVSQEDLLFFHASHFSAKATAHFAQEFLGPVEEEVHEEDDGLGYYENGVKRTLTDEQIQIFRHSEIEAILRDRRRAKDANYIGKQGPPSEIRSEIPSEHTEDGEVEDEELATTPTPLFIGPMAPLSGSFQAQSGKKKRNRNRNKSHQKKRGMERDPVEKGFFRATVKPDLRKRTWDKVEIGLEDLQYDDVDSGTAAAPSRGPQRRKISYEDD